MASGVINAIIIYLQVYSPYKNKEKLEEHRKIDDDATKEQKEDQSNEKSADQPKEQNEEEPKDHL